MTGPVYLSNPDRNQIVEILRRRANDIATFKSDIEQDVGKKLNGFPGSVEMALTREMKRLRRLAGCAASRAGSPCRRNPKKRTRNNL